MNNLSQNIDKQLVLINSILEWSKKYKKESFNNQRFKDFRRVAKKIKNSISNRCSVAAYGESQVGKSYLMSSLLSSSTTPFVITDGDKEYSFIDKINSSGGNNAKIESTGLITRFTTECKNEKMRNYVKVQNLSIVDILMLIVDSYYNDIKINLKTSLSSSDINKSLINLQKSWNKQIPSQTVIEEDDIREIEDYIKDVIGNNASSLLSSDFFNVIAENIKYISIESWDEVFSLMWNRNELMSRLFISLLNEYRKISFIQEIYVPFSAVIRDNGTILKVQWLDLICGKKSDDPEGFPIMTTEIYGSDENLLASDFSKSFLSAIAAEVTFILPSTIAQERGFLDKIDLLDFPGARPRLGDEKREAELKYAEDMPEILRRGKVAYLFNKYTRDRLIGSVLACFHNDQKGASIGNSLTSWIEKEIGATPELRARNIKNIGRSPLFIVATKFNKDLSRHKDDKEGALTNHWSRFNVTLPEAMSSCRWFNDWVSQNDNLKPFKHIFPLRDFFWSGIGPDKSYLFDGYSDGSNSPKSAEKGQHQQEGFPNYFEELKRSFVTEESVIRCFENPEETWEDVATVNNDGSKAIIRAITEISDKLHSAREKHYLEELNEIKASMHKLLSVYYEPEDDASKNNKVKSITSKIRASLLLSIAKKPEIFGKIIDNLMIEPEEFRKIARNIIILQTETPRDYSDINFLRAHIGINPNDDESVNLQKIYKHFSGLTKEDIEEEFAKQNCSIEDVISNDHEFCATVSDVITKHILKCWGEHLNNSVQLLGDYISYPEEVIVTFQNLVKKLKIKQQLTDRFSKYETMFNVNERLNAIADYAALELNNFVSNVGRKYMTEEHIKEISEKARICEINVDLSKQGIQLSHDKQTIEGALKALDDSVDIMRQPRFNESDMLTLRKLPLWDNFQRWQNLLLIGMILSSGISTKNPEENRSIKELLDQINSLY